MGVGWAAGVFPSLGDREFGPRRPPHVRGVAGLLCRGSPSRGGARGVGFSWVVSGVPSATVPHLFGGGGGPSCPAHIRTITTVSRPGQ